MQKLDVNELRRVLNQVATLLDTAMALSAVDEDLEKRLRAIREQLRDEQNYLDGLARLRL